MKQGGDEDAANSAHALEHSVPAVSPKHSRMQIDPLRQPMARSVRVAISAAAGPWCRIRCSKHRRLLLHRLLLRLRRTARRGHRRDAVASTAAGVQGHRRVALRPAAARVETNAHRHASKGWAARSQPASRITPLADTSRRCVLQRGRTPRNPKRVKCVHHACAEPLAKGRRPSASSRASRRAGDVMPPAT